MREQDDRGRMTFAIRKNAEDIARSLFKTNMSHYEIAEHTKLTIEQIEKLRAEK